MELRSLIKPYSADSLETGLAVQRRRRPKVEPRNVFGSNLQPRPVKKPIPERKSVPVKRPPQNKSIPLVKEKVLPKIIPINDGKEESESNLEPTPDIIVDENNDIESIEAESEIIEDQELVANQILGTKPKRGIGLKKKENLTQVEEGTNMPSSKAMELIEKSRLRANEIKITKVKVPSVKAKSAPVIKKARSRNRQKNYQPAARLKRLDRSKHMEYKYEMRGLLESLNVAEEYRSNLLAGIWAKGERQSTKEAREYINEKLEDGVLDENQHKSLTKIIDNYTTRR